MIEPLLRSIVSAMLRTILAPADTSAHHERLTEEMIVKVLNMPRYMGVGVVGLTLAFDGEAVSRHGRRFVQLDPAAQAEQLDRWRRSRIPLKRLLVDVYEKMGTFIYYDLVEQAEHAA